MRFAVISSFMVLILILAIAAIIGVYVYKDASRRGMNAALWTIVAVFAPSLIGLIIYLLVRGSYSDLNCPKCQEKVTEEFVVCPQCGTKLKCTCPVCAYPCEAGWTVCPKCATSLPEQTADVTPPIKRNDKTLGKILIAVIVIPLLLLFTIILFGATGFSAGATMSGETFMPVEEYVAEKDDPEITQWIESCDNTAEKVYALRYTREEGEQKITSLAVYFPLEMFDSIQTKTEKGLFKKYANIEFGGDGHRFVDQKYNFLLFTSGDDAYLTLKAAYNGKEVPCQVTDVDFDPSIDE